MNRNDIAAEVRKLIAAKQKTAKRQPPCAFTEDANFTDDLGFDSLDMIEFAMAAEGRFDLEISDDDAEGLKSVGQAIEYMVRRLDAAEERCIACDVAFKEGDMVLSDVGGGALHAACCGPERESYVKDVGTGEPLGAGDPIPAGYRWSKWPKVAEPA